MLTPDSHCLLAEGAAALGIAINPQQIEQLHDFSQLIVKWNKTHNLTAITEINEYQQSFQCFKTDIVPVI